MGVCHVKCLYIVNMSACLRVTEVKTNHHRSIRLIQKQYYCANLLGMYSHRKPQEARTLVEIFVVTHIEARCSIFGGKFTAANK